VVWSHTFFIHYWPPDKMAFMLAVLLLLLLRLLLLLLQYTF